MDLFEYLGSFVKRLDIYTKIDLTPIMTDIVVKIMVQLLSVLALATKQISQKRFSKCAVNVYIVCGSLYDREVRKETVRRNRDRGSTPKTGSIDPGGGTDNRRADVGCGPRSCG